MGTGTPWVQSVCVLRLGASSTCRLGDRAPLGAISAVVSAPPSHVAARPRRDIRRCAAFLRRALFAIALCVALSWCSPLTADASTASVTLTPFGYFALFVQAGVGEANNVSIVRAPNGFEYLIEDLGAAIAPGSGCTSADANHLICAGDAVQQVFVVLEDGDDRLTTAGLVYPESALPFGQAPVAARGGDGSDTVLGGAGFDDFEGNVGDDLLDGGAGDDSVSGGEGDDALNGGDGRDLALGGDDDDTVLGGPGDDVGVRGGAGDDTVDGGDGNDAVMGNEGRDQVLGGAGNDRVDFALSSESDVAIGADTLQGGPGDDEFYGGPAGSGSVPDEISGGDGTDTVDFSGRTAPVTVDLDGRANDGEAGEGDNVHGDVETVIGGPDDDKLTGSSVANNLDGRDGEDTLDGQGGDDMLDGRDGEDTLDGQGGDDMLDGRDGEDTLDGQGGDDMLVGGVGDVAGDTLRGGDGRDTLTAGPGEDSLTGGEDDDTLLGGGGADAVDGNGGNDTIEGGAGGDALDGGSGNDSLNGGAVVLVGADGDDRLDGGPGADELLGGRGNDLLDGGPNADRVSGEAGKDTVTYEEGRTNPVRVSLNDLPDDGESDEHDNVRPDIEVVVGGARGDDLSGDADINTVDGGRGEDLIDGQLDPDRLLGGEAPDIIRARDGVADEVVDCGDAGDLAITDGRDKVRDCETVDRPGARRLVVGRYALVRPQAEFRLRLPEGHRFFRLTENLKIPLGSTIDPQAGVVRLATATNSAGARQFASISAGQFTVRQKRGRRPVTQLQLAGRLPDCPRSSTTGRTAKPAARSTARRLLVDLDKRKRKPKGRHDNYTVRGKHSIAGAPGTAWLTEDRCDGTLTTVISGSVHVRDFGRGKTVTVRPGKPYLAAAS
jgi:Ca2+-binding RTX toxin-like protein